MLYYIKINNVEWIVEKLCKGDKDDYCRIYGLDRKELKNIGYSVRRVDNDNVEFLVSDDYEKDIKNIMKEYLM